MKAVVFEQFGAPEVLKLVDREMPVPGPGEILIKVDAVGVNYADTVRRRGLPYPRPTPLPFVLGFEVAGTVAALGEGVEGPAVGTSVFATPGEGGYTQYVCVPAAIVIPIPSELDTVQAAALSLQGLTAALSLKYSARIQPGDTVLVQAAGGGVGGLAVQLAKIYGAKTVIAVASSAEKRQHAIDLGADVAIDYTEQGWPEKVKKATDGKGVDIVLEMTGGDILGQSLSCMAPFGRMVVYGLASGETATVDPQLLLGANQTITGFNVGGYMLGSDTSVVQATIVELIQLVLSGQLKLNIGATLPLSEAPRAHAMIQNRETSGKVILLPWA